MNISTKFSVTVLALAMAMTTAWAQDGGGSLQRKLDKPVRLNLRNTPLGMVFRALTRQTGVAFDVAPETYLALPYGEDTRLDVTLPGQSLRTTLTKMLARQALDWAVAGAAVRVMPSPPLHRIARRATYDELRRLGLLQTLRVTEMAKGGIGATLAQVTGQKEWRVILPAAWTDKQVSQFQQKFAKAPVGLASDWLDAGCGRALTWYVDGDRIVILSREDQVRRQLERRVSLRYQNTPLMTVLLDLARKARVKVNPTPGVMNFLPPAVRQNFTLVMADASIDQALKVISGSTGLEFPISVEGIGVRRADSVPLSPPETRGTGPEASPGIFVQTVIPTSSGRELRVFFVPGAMSTELQAALEAERERIVKELEKHFVTSAEKPTQDD